MRSLYREFVVAQQRQRDEHDKRITLAWQVAALSRQERLPKLERLLAKAHEPQTPQTKQTPEAQRFVMEQLSARLGIPLRKVRLVHVEAPR